MPGIDDVRAGLRGPLGAARLVPLLACVAWVVRGDWGGAVTLGALAVALVAVGALRPPRGLDLAFVGVVLLPTAVELLGLYDRLSWIDSAIHALVPAVLAPLAYVLLARAGALPWPGEPPGRWATVLLCVALGAATGALWELLEWTADSVTGSRLQEGLADTNRDLLADAAGSLLGAVVLALRPPARGSSPRTGAGPEALADRH
ncbi:hypothetical protein [Conexibacter sp. SYSU D00693]|uniref:hypothetical protein n=1 Tax=Conexibacter sp. SYSU D00693 TaxID=2812560 RepID=UPI00196AC4C0|nr:hypothetical protein [Conexibacter sp. SYSU D00693]